MLLLCLYVKNQLMIISFFPFIIQVWAGNEACEPVTWRECKLVPRQVDFKVPKITCEDGEDVPYQDMQDAEKTQMTTKMTCEVKHTSNYKPVTSTKCQSITYTECAEIPQETCETVQMQVPKQVSKKVLCAVSSSKIYTYQNAMANHLTYWKIAILATQCFRECYWIVLTFLASNLTVK